MKPDTIALVLRILSYVFFMIIGGLLVFLFFVPRSVPAKIPVSTPDSTWTYWYRDLNKAMKVAVKLLADVAGLYPVHDTIFLPHDTIPIGPQDPLASIPVRESTVKDSLPITINHKKYSLPFKLSITQRGILYNYTIETVPRVHEYEIFIPRDPALKFSGYLGIGIDLDKKIIPEAEVMLTYKKRIGLAGRGEISTELDHEGRTRINAAGRAVLKAFF